ADLTEIGFGVRQTDRGKGGAHARILGTLGAHLVDVEIGHLDRQPETFVKRESGIRWTCLKLEHAISNTFDRKPARDFSGKSAAHSVGDSDHRSVITLTKRGEILSRVSIK